MCGSLVLNIFYLVYMLCAILSSAKCPCYCKNTFPSYQTSQLLTQLLLEGLWLTSTTKIHLSLLTYIIYFYTSFFSPSSCSNVLSLIFAVYEFELHNHFATDMYVPSIQGEITWKEHLSKLTIKNLPELRCPQLIGRSVIAISKSSKPSTGSQRQNYCTASPQSKSSAA